MSQPTAPMQLYRLLEAEPSQIMPRRSIGTSAIASRVGWVELVTSLFVNQ